jgi:hypothetical protein
MEQGLNDAVAINVAIMEAFGIDPKSIRPNATIRLDKHLGPVVTVEHFRFNEAGKKFADPNGEVATILRRYRLVPIEDD